MTPNDAIKLSLDASSMVCMMYLEDLTDEEMMVRPEKGTNHINWQVGHLVVEENHMMNAIRPGSMPELPAGMAEKYTKEAAKSDNPADFCTKAELLAAAKVQRERTLELLAAEDPANFPNETGVPYAPTVGSMYSMQGSHWLMHAGQWVIVRRKVGRAPLF